MCGYIPANQYDVLNLVLIVVDTLREEFVKQESEIPLLEDIESAVGEEYVIEFD